jgi:hypothetical protein
MEGRIEACQHCAIRVEDPNQRLCPNCLNDLRTKSFNTEEGFERYREDRKAHGAKVDDQESDGRPLLALGLAFAAMIMLVAAGGIMFRAFSQGSWGAVANSMTQAVTPLAFGFAMAVAAHKVNGG